ncbi:MAG: ribosomal protein S18 acetylase RimI-like enzyme [Francisellaceae bacterium]|jgi:ribosomal protein S18 acetylase RimI-like enzyme
MNIRIATYKDNGVIASIHAESWKIGYENVLSEDYLNNIVPEERKIIWDSTLKSPKTNQKIFVAEVDDHIVGFVCVLLDEDPTHGSYIDNLHIEKTHQSKGIGKLLLLTAAQLCDDYSSSSKLFLLVTQHNIRAQQFYKRLGGVNTDITKWVAPNGTVVPTYKFVWDNVKCLLKYN